ncbi:hypothetical protein F183_A11380 [Bryobacterales bacterium F-183]|nr:hypothetical protein F183_A11380 [Bryobacterales bacterium F-183]
MSTSALILTAWMDAESQAVFDALREAHFPPERNYLKAHVTLFHALPGDRVDEIVGLLSPVAAETAVIEGRTSRVRFLGRGVAYDVECPELGRVRARLQAAMRGVLTLQDSQAGYRPHITVQNKVEPEVARRLLAALTAGFGSRRIVFEGLVLWEYLGGPWRHLQDFAFAAAGAPPRVGL